MTGAGSVIGPRKQHLLEVRESHDLTADLPCPLGLERVEACSSAPPAAMAGPGGGGGSRTHRRIVAPDAARRVVAGGRGHIPVHQHAEEGRLAEEAIGRPFGELDARHEPRLDPARARARVACPESVESERAMAANAASRSRRVRPSRPLPTWPAWTRPSGPWTATISEPRSSSLPCRGSQPMTATVLRRPRP